MKIFWAILSCILLGYFWIRLIQYIFARNQKKSSWKLFWVCSLLVVSLFIFTYLLQLIFPAINNIEDWIVSLKRWWCFLLYCWLIFLLLILLAKNQKKKQIWFLFITWLLLFLIVILFGLKIWISATILLPLISAYAEEFLKIGATENEVSKGNFYSSDLLFFSIFIALWFSIVENFFYLWCELFSSEESGLLAMVFGRWIFTSLIHFIATGLTALLLYKYYQQQKLKGLNIFQKISRIVVAILIWALVHRWYNLSIQYAKFIIYIIVVFGGYLLLTYLLFLSDSLYEDKSKKKK